MYSLMMMILLMPEEAVLSLRRVALETIKLCSKESESVNQQMKTINKSKPGHLRNQELHLGAVGVEVLSNHSPKLISLVIRAIIEVLKTLMMMMVKEMIN